MIRVSDITDAWLAAWSMAKGDPTWTERLDMSAPAVFRSFWALALAVPAFLVGLTAQRRVLLAQPETVQAQFLAAMPEPLYFGGLLGAAAVDGLRQSLPTPTAFGAVFIAEALLFVLAAALALRVMQQPTSRVPTQLVPGE